MSVKFIVSILVIVLSIVLYILLFLLAKKWYKELVQEGKKATE
ncbi:MAG: hypothetical protein Q6363_000345 [Candidatus Njordarchaeota archaeon]